MSDIDNVRSGTLLALANRGEGRSFAAYALCSISVRTRASGACGACGAIVIDYIWCLANSALDTESRVGRACACRARCPIVVRFFTRRAGRARLMSGVDDVRRGTLLALTNRGESRAHATYALCSIIVGASARGTSGA